MSFTVQIKGIKEFEKALAAQPEKASKAAAMAINDIVRKTYAYTKRKIMRSVNLKASYLDGRDGGQPRLKISQFAKDTDLKAVIVGRQRATSLNRFGATQLYGTSKKGKKIKAGISVNIKGRKKKIPKAFFVNLKRGTAENGNIGVAIRVKSGERVDGKKLSGQPMGGAGNSDVYLLYGPSVEQLFRTQIADDGAIFASDHLDREFQRQFARLNRG